MFGFGSDHIVPDPTVMRICVQLYRNQYISEDMSNLKRVEYQVTLFSPYLFRVASGDFLSVLPIQTILMRVRIRPLKKTGS
jgi:hypothetical protein